jgi:hypothetical protein
VAGAELTLVNLDLQYMHTGNMGDAQKTHGKNDKDLPSLRYVPSCASYHLHTTNAQAAMRRNPHQRLLRRDVLPMR